MCSVPSSPSMTASLALFLLWAWDNWWEAFALYNLLLARAKTCRFDISVCLKSSSTSGLPALLPFRDPVCLHPRASAFAPTG